MKAMLALYMGRGPWMFTPPIAYSKQTRNG